eukprot:jgi/Botrbrau1/9683/Bobra.0201s0014.1
MDAIQLGVIQMYNGLEVNPLDSRGCIDGIHWVGGVPKITDLLHDGASLYSYLGNQACCIGVSATEARLNS